MVMESLAKVTYGSTATSGCQSRSLEGGIARHHTTMPMKMRRNPARAKRCGRTKSSPIVVPNTKAPLNAMRSEVRIVQSERPPDRHAEQNHPSNGANEHMPEFPRELHERAPPPRFT